MTMGDKKVAKITVEMGDEREVPDEAINIDVRFTFSDPRSN